MQMSRWLGRLVAYLLFILLEAGPAGAHWRVCWSAGFSYPEKDCYDNHVVLMLITSVSRRRHVGKAAAEIEIELFLFFSSSFSFCVVHGLSAALVVAPRAPPCVGVCVCVCVCGVWCVLRVCVSGRGDVCDAVDALQVARIKRVHLINFYTPPLFFG